MTIAAEAANQNAAEPKPGEQKPGQGEAKPGEQKPGEQKLGEQKPGEEKPGEKKPDSQEPKPGERKEGEEKPQPKAPAEYKLVVPDDAKQYLPERDLKFLQEVARKNDMTNDEAQALLNEQATLVMARATEYLEETKADKQYGGANLEQTTRSVHRLINAIRPEGHPRRESFLRFMNQGGAGNHIDVLSFLADIAKKIAEDDPTHTGGEGKGEKKSLADRLYGGTPKAKE